MSPKLVNKGYNGWAQLGIFLGMCGIGLVAAGAASVACWSLMTGTSPLVMEKEMMNPAYAGAIKMIQFISTLFIFFIPAISWAFICYKNGWIALGVQKSIYWKVAGISILILVASMPFIDWISLVNKAIPLPAASRKYFEGMEKNYDEQVKLIGNVKTAGQYVLSLFIIALLPAIFEEAFFRGTLQNLLSRWKNSGTVYIFLLAILAIAVRQIWFPQSNGWFFYGFLLVALLIVFRSHAITGAINRLTNHWLLPIIFTSILFSAVHLSWYGFIPRFILGMVLGLIFYRTNNLFYNMLVHFVNNAAVITVMFFEAKQIKPAEPAAEQQFPWWAALISIVILFLLFRLLRKLPQSPKPVEILEDRNNPFANTIFENKEKDESE
jgi:membrane protease YdiL (CAAX protease family)